MVTELHQVRASAVPTVPRTLTASERLAALELARCIQDFREHRNVTAPYVIKLLDDSCSLLLELAGDAKGER